MEKMKRNSCLLIVAALIIGCLSCKKDPDIQLGKIRIIEKEKQFFVHNDSISAILLSECSYSGTIDDITLRISLTKDFSDAIDYVTKLSDKNFSIVIHGLLPDTTYYYKYYVNRISVEFGNETVWEEDSTRVFYTDHLQFVPCVITQKIMNITQNDAIGCGFVENSGSGELIDCGVCWSSNSNPSVEGMHGSFGAMLGEFAVQLSDLNKETTYYMRAYAENAFGVGYGEVIRFKTKSADSEGLSVSTLEPSFNESYVITLHGKAVDLNYNGSIHTDNRNYGFLFGLSPSTDMTSGASSVSTSNKVTNFQAIIHVDVNKVYYYRAFAIDYRTGERILGQLKTIFITSK